MQKLATLLLVALIVAGVFYLLRLLSPYLAPFAIALLLAYLFNPIVDFFQYRLRFKNRVVSVIATLFLILGVMVLLWLLLAPAVRAETNQAAQLISKYSEQIERPAWLPENLEETIQRYLQMEEIQQLFSREDSATYLQKIGGWLWQGISGVGSFLLGLFSLVTLLLYLVFIMISYDDFREYWDDYIPPRWRGPVVTLTHDVKNGMKAYFRAQAEIVLIVSILFALGFKLIGLPLGIVLGIIVGLLNFVPYLQIAGVLPAILLAFLHSLEADISFWVMLLLVLVVFAVVQAIQDVLLTPRIMGDLTGLNPAVILLALSIWGGLLGIIGMVIALPMTTLLLAYYRKFVLEPATTKEPDEEQE